MKEFIHKVVSHLDKLDDAERGRQFRSLVGEVDFFESVLTTMREGVIVVSTDGVVLYANAAAGRLAAFDATRAKGRAVRQLLPDWDWRDLLAPADASNWRRNATRELEVSYPERRVLEIQSSPSATGSVLLVRDVTQDRARAADALESGRNDAIRELAAGVAHEIGNPLNAMALNLDLLAREFRRETEAERRERLLADVAVLRDEVKRIDSINRSFLAALRPVAPVLAPGNAADPLKTTLAELKGRFESRNVRVSLDLPGALPPVALDAGQMGQVYFNLAKNAVEAMKDGGRLEIEVASDDREVTVAFRDSGAGMNDETLARVFEPYRTTKRGGNGLGLMICRRIVRAHGGDIDVESKEGEGTRFTVHLPRLSQRVRSLT